MLERVRRVVVPLVLPPFRLNKDGGAGTPVSVAGVCLIFRYFTDMLVPPFPTRMVAPVHIPSLEYVWGCWNELGGLWCPLHSPLFV
jgi:hypothetical protein